MTTSIMRALFYLIICFLFTATVLSGQSEIQWEGTHLLLENSYQFNKPVKYDDAITNSDAEYLKLFKQYFNPGSITSFRNHYLPSDWIGATLKEYEDWQSYLKANPIYLENVILLSKDNDHFLIFQYAVENQFYTIYQSSEFKRIGQSWKHTNMAKDEIAPLLSKIGTVSPKYLSEQINNRKSGIDLDVMATQHARTHVEKFDRAKIFEMLIPLFENRSVSEEDVTAARQFFIDYRDNEMISYISSRYKWPEIELTDMMNTACGFELFNYVSGARNEN
jgi:hypothetical protein